MARVGTPQSIGTFGHYPTGNAIAVGTAGWFTRNGPGAFTKLLPTGDPVLRRDIQRLNVILRDIFTRLDDLEGRSDD